jgi:micrococcal nuclease
MDDLEVENTRRFKIESVIIALLALAFLFALIAMVASAVAEPIDAHRIRVIDGDTIAVKGMRRDVRLVGFNAPETRDPLCLNEQILGRKAKRRLIALLAIGPADLNLVSCACEPKTEGTYRCNYGRLCGTLTVSGNDVGSLLIGEGLAVPFRCNDTSCPKTPRPWCD